jgi:cbb3-type cytochrome oxidase subunit 3
VMVETLTTIAMLIFLLVIVGIVFDLGRRG